MCFQKQQLEALRRETSTAQAMVYCLFQLISRLFRMHRIVGDLQSSRLTKLAEADRSTEAESVRLKQEIAGVVDQAKLALHSFQVAKEQAGKCLSCVTKIPIMLLPSIGICCVA